eukprot:g11440.t2
MECVYPVHVAAERGDDETLRLLWEEGCDMEETDDYGRTPMDLAYAADVKGSHRYVLELLRRAALRAKEQELEAELRTRLYQDSDLLPVLRWAASELVQVGAHKQFARSFAVLF